MKIPNLFCILLIPLLLAIYAGVPLKNNDWINETIDLTINTQFEEAESIIFDRLARGDSSLSVYFYYASILNSKMTHFENDIEADLFSITLEKVVKQATVFIEKAPAGDSAKLAQYFFYRGSALGYLAYYEGKQGQWFSALDHGLASINDLQNSLKLDSTLYDAYLGIGIYKYWRTTKLKFMVWLPFVPDMRDEGIQLIKKAITRGNYSAALGMHQLIYILLDFGKYDEAVSYAEKVIQVYPQSQFMRWAHAHVYFKRREYDKAIPSYQKLLELIEKDAHHNPGHWLFCQARLAEIYFRLNAYEATLQHTQRILQSKLSASLSERERNYLQKVRKWDNESRAALKRLSLQKQNQD